MLMVLTLAGCTIGNNQTVEFSQDQLDEMERVGIYAYDNFEWEKTYTRKEIVEAIENDLENYLYTIYLSRNSSDDEYYWGKEISKQTVENHLEGLYGIKDMDYSIFDSTPDINKEYGIIYDSDKEIFQTYMDVTEYKDFASVSRVMNYSDSRKIYVECGPFVDPEVEPDIYFVAFGESVIKYAPTSKGSYGYTIAEIQVYALG